MCLNSWRSHAEKLFSENIAYFTPKMNLRNIKESIYQGQSIQKYLILIYFRKKLHWSHGIQSGWCRVGEPVQVEAAQGSRSQLFLHLRPRRWTTAAIDNSDFHQCGFTSHHRHRPQDDVTSDTPRRPWHLRLQGNTDIPHWWLVNMVGTRCEWARCPVLFVFKLSSCVWWNALIRWISFYLTKINCYRGDLIDVSATKQTRMQSRNLVEQSRTATHCVS